jgi:long-chain acyl-CoA synthetase
LDLFLKYGNLCEIPERNSRLFPGRVSHKFRGRSGFVTRTFLDFYGDIAALSAGLFLKGVKKGSHAAFFTDNRYEWALTDYALMSVGAISVPRGSDTSPLEQKFIFSHSDSTFLIMENSSHLNGLLALFSPGETAGIERIFLMDGPAGDEFPALQSIKGKITLYSELLEAGRAHVSANPGFYKSLLSGISTDDLATIIYTSGTSGNPKGVMLTHGNFLHNVRAITPLLWIDIGKGEKTVSILPSWHVYERSFEYCAGAGAMSIFYSSIKTLAEDLMNEKPELVCSVPRVWESIYEKMMTKIEKGPPAKRILFDFLLSAAKARLSARNFMLGHFVSYKKPGLLSRVLNRLLLASLYPLYALSQKIFAPVRALLGGNLRASISGGGSLPPHIDLAFNAMGIRLVNAYGMTETSPGAITRRLDRSTTGSIGIPLDEVEVKIVKGNNWPAGFGEHGLIYVRGPNVMKGYYKNPEATKEILSPDGWINTGDLGAMSQSGDIVMTGRAKSTIVLLGGENLEPEPIEEKLKESSLIEHAVVIGQDKKSPIALITINEERLKALAGRLKISWDELVSKSGEIIKNNKIIAEVNREIKKLINRANGFKPFERIHNFVLLKKKFTIGDELTQTLKVKRQHVEKKYKHLL